MSDRERRIGFTIVELLIVIVVIGILAGITIVAYNGVQSRARNSQTANAARIYLNAFSNYVTINNAYPPVADTSINYCLGQGVSTCTGAAAAPSWQVSTTLDNSLRTVISALPKPSNGPGTNQLDDPSLGYIPYRGGIINPTLDGVNSAFLLYTVEGLVRCPVGNVASGLWPNFSSTPPTNGYTYDRNSSVSVCWIALPRA